MKTPFTAVYAFLFFLIPFFVLHAQNTSKIEITYYQAITDKAITHSDQPKILKDLDYILQFTPTESLFKNIPQMASDGYRSNRRHVYLSGADGIFYQNLETGQKYLATSMYGKDFRIKTRRYKGQWKLTKETKQIDQYLCHKATYMFTRPKYPDIHIPITAWYTLDLPFPFGPLQYGGLPGVILELDFLDYAFVAKKINFDADFKIIPPQGELATHQELNTIFEKKTGINIEEEMKKKMKNELKKETR